MPAERSVRSHPTLWIAATMCVVAVAVTGALTVFACGALAVVTVSPPAGPPGATINVAGSGFYPPGGIVTATFNGPSTVLWSGPQQPNGTIAFTFTVPNSPPGVYYLRFTETSRSVTTTSVPSAFQITAQATPAPTSMPAPPRSAVPSASPAFVRSTSSGVTAPNAPASGTSAPVAAATGSGHAAVAAREAPPQSRALGIDIGSGSSARVAAVPNNARPVAIIAGGTAGAIALLVAGFFVGRRALQRSSRRGGE